MLADQPSRTARGVALARAAFDRPTVVGGDADAEARLVADLRRDDEERRRGSFLATRTRFVDEAVLAAIAGPVTQVVVVGAGYDCRSLRFRSAGVRFFELDHPATQRDKRRRLAALAADTDDVTYAEIDLIETDVAEVLVAHGHRDDEPTSFVCEGLVLYLPRDATRRAFRSMAARAAPGSELVASMPMAGATANRAGFDRRVAAIGEDALARYTHDEVVELFTATGWDPARIVDPATMPTGDGAGAGRALLVEASVAAG